jgi:hypothetical protein
MKTGQLFVLASVLLGAGIAGDVAIQRTNPDETLKVAGVDLKSDTVAFEGPSFSDRALAVAKKQHLAVIAGGVAAWWPLAAAWRRRKKA